MEKVKSSSSPRDKAVCRYGKGCFKFKCPFHHPEPRTIDLPNVTPIKEGSMLEHITASFGTLDVKRESLPAKSADVTPKKPCSADKSHEKQRRTPQSIKSTSSSSKGTPIYHFREPAIVASSTDFHDSFKAAGAMFIRHDEHGNMEVLLGIEFRSREDKRLHAIGGRRDFQRETHFDVAAREFWEETGELVPQAIINNCLSASTTKAVWIGAGKYVLYLVSECPVELNDISARYAALTTKDEMLSLHWCKWNDVINKNNAALPERISSFLQQILDDVMRLKVMDSFTLTTTTAEAGEGEGLSKADTTITTKVEVAIELNKEDKIIDYDEVTAALEARQEAQANTLLEHLIKEVTTPPPGKKSSQDDSS